MWGIWFEDDKCWLSHSDDSKVEYDTKEIAKFHLEKRRGGCVDGNSNRGEIKQLPEKAIYGIWITDTLNDKAYWYQWYRNEDAGVLWYEKLRVARGHLNQIRVDDAHAEVKIFGENGEPRDI